MDKSLDERIKENLRFEIEHCGKRKIDVARGIGVDSSTISQYLSGRAQPTLATLSKLCNFIGCSADDILEIKRDDD